MMPFTFHMPVEVISGLNAADQLDSFRGRFQRPAILCGSASARRSGALDRVLHHFPGASVLEGVPENPSTATCDELAESGRKQGIDGLIALGGGSVLDAAKAVALLLPNRGMCTDYFAQAPLQWPVPVIAIPTTAGTGSEVTPYAVLVDRESGKKKTLKHRGLFPIAAILDPALTATMPPEVTLATGLDALSQGMEGYLSRRATTPGDLMALEVCRLVRDALPRVMRNPDEVEAREAMLYAAMLSGVVIAQSGTTLVHGMGYYYTLEHGIAHGAANALLLPPVFVWNARFAPEKVAALAGALGRPCSAESDSVAGAIADALFDLYARVGFKAAARDHGVPESSSQKFAEDIISDPYRFKNQIGELSQNDVRQLFERAWHGEMVPF